MTDQSPPVGSTYRRMEPTEISAILLQSPDPVRTVLEEIDKIFADPKYQKWLLSQGSIPNPVLLPWLQELYTLGMKDGMGL